MSEAVTDLADSDLAELATALRAGRLSQPFAPASLQSLVPAEARSAVARDLQRLAAAGLAAAQIATLLEVLVADRRKRLRLDDMIDLVTTGPEGVGIANRDTGVVVRGLFARAERSVLVVGFAVHQGQQVFRALADRMAERPNLKVRLCLDVRRQISDTSAPDQIVHAFASRFRSTQWPLQRPVPEVFYDPRGAEVATAKRASLHAKCIVVDGETSFVSSANFTEAAQERNIEVGLLIRSAWLAHRLAMHFDAMISDRLLVRLPLPMPSPTSH